LAPRLLTPKKTYTFDYPQALEFAAKQRHSYWPPDEIDVESDLADLTHRATEPELDGIIKGLTLFTHYELWAGKDYWLGRVMDTFPRPDIQQMAATFGFFELSVHAVFYNRINEVLNLNTDEFYESYKKDPVLSDRMKFIGDVVNSDDNLLSLGAFSMIEGAVLYSTFAYLRHFQEGSKNLIPNICSGLNFSVVDENIHCEAGAWLFRTLKAEMGISKREDNLVKSKLSECAHKIFEHESHIIDSFFEKGRIAGISSIQLKNFVKKRLNHCMIQLGYSSIFTVDSDKIGEWFYERIRGLKSNDFFVVQGAEYTTNVYPEQFSFIKDA